MSTSPRTWLLKLLLSVAGIGLAMAVVEIGLRLFHSHSRVIRQLCYLPGDSSTDLGRVDTLEAVRSRIPFAPEPGAIWHGFVLNSQGFRTSEYEIRKHPGALRIALVGDSFTFDCAALPYPLHFSALLEQLFRRCAPGRSTEVLNLGLPAVGPALEQRILEIEGLRLKPDVVIWSFFVGNDFTDERIEPTDASASGFLRHSYGLRLVRNGVRLLTGVKRAGGLDRAAGSGEGYGTYIGDPDEFDPLAPTFDEPTFLRIQGQRAFVYDPWQFPTAQWERIQEILVEVKAACESRGVELLVVIVPDETQVDPELLDKVLAVSGADRDRWSMDLPQQKLTRFLVRNDIEFIDLLPEFQRQHADRRLYTLQDTHWNAEGNRLAARLIAEALGTLLPAAAGSPPLDPRCIDASLAPLDDGRDAK